MSGNAGFTGETQFCPYGTMTPSLYGLPNSPISDFHELQIVHIIIIRLKVGILKIELF